ncbi:hypothetical protein WAI453_001640 [Rhynchosporium graminicola]
MTSKRTRPVEGASDMDWAPEKRAKQARSNNSVAVSRPGIKSLADDIQDVYEHTPSTSLPTEVSSGFQAFDNFRRRILTQKRRLEPPLRACSVASTTHSSAASSNRAKKYENMSDGGDADEESSNFSAASSRVNTTVSSAPSSVISSSQSANEDVNMQEDRGDTKSSPSLTFDQELAIERMVRLMRSNHNGNRLSVELNEKSSRISDNIEDLVKSMGSLAVEIKDESGHCTA